MTKECKFLQSWLRCCSSSKCWDAEAMRRPLRRGCRCGCLKGRAGWGRSKGRSAETSRKTTIGCRTSPNDRETPTCQNKDLKFKHYFLNDLPQPLISHVQVRTNFTSLFCKKRKKERNRLLIVFSLFFDRSKLLRCTSESNGHSDISSNRLWDSCRLCSSPLLRKMSLGNMWIRLELRSLPKIIVKL